MAEATISYAGLRRRAPEWVGIRVSRDDLMNSSRVRFGIEASADLVTSTVNLNVPVDHVADTITEASLGMLAERLEERARELRDWIGEGRCRG